MIVDCAARGFSGEGRCIEIAVDGGLCREHAAIGAKPFDWDADA